MRLIQGEIIQFCLICLLLIGVGLSSACSIIADDEAGMVLVESVSLPAELNETSGLHCPRDERLYTLNDSGNSAVVYQIDSKGNMLNAANIDHPNKDWEALAGDTDYLYIGDIGNNSGKRETINVVVIEKGSLQKVSVLNVVYATNKSAQNEYLKHDFDAEALVSYEDKLILFSKSWLTRKLHIYALSKTEQQQSIEPIANLEGLPGVVTGADYNQATNQFVLVGYNLSSFGLFSPFLAILNADFSLVKNYSLPGLTQVEGVCVSASGNIWVSQEGTLLSGPKLAHISIQ